MPAADRTDLNALLVFAAVAEAGGFTAAAERLGVAKAKVSVELRRLEQQLGVALLTRTTRRVALTEAGHALFAECIPQLRGAQDALARVVGGGAEPSGTLRIGCTVDHAVESLAPAVAEFALLHPAVQVELRTSDRIIDVVEEGLDVTFRLGWLRDSSMRALKLAQFAQRVVASPAYVRRCGLPREPGELARHEWIALSLLRSPLTWTFTSAAGEVRTVRMKGRLRADSTAALRALLEAGAGVSVLDEFSTRQALQSGRLVELLPQWSAPVGGLYAVYPPGRHRPARVRSFIDFYRASLLRGFAR